MLFPFMGLTFALSYWVMILVWNIIVFIAGYKIFIKAGIEGWKSFIPFVNFYYMSKIAFGNGWWFLVTLVPYVSGIYFVALNITLAKVFNRSFLFGLGLLFFNPIFMFILGFDDSMYSGPLQSFYDGF